MLPMLQRAKVPAEDTEILRVLIRHAPTYALQARADGEWSQLFEVYLDALEGFSVHNIEGAFLRWNRGEDMKDPAMGQFFPKPAQLVALATKDKSEVWMAAYRAKKALDFVEKTGQDWTPERRAAERQKSIDAGHLNPDGSLKLPPMGRRMPEAPRPTSSPQQLAQELRQADAKARLGGTPISRHHTEEPDDVGDVV